MKSTLSPTCSLTLLGSFKHLKQAVQQRLAGGVNELLSECIEVWQYHYEDSVYSMNQSKFTYYGAQKLIPSASHNMTESLAVRTTKKRRVGDNCEVGMSA